jgi:hypothetical protein
MSNKRIGKRIGALLNVDDNGTAFFLGYGEYVGDFVPEEAVGGMAEGCREYKIKNPKLLLDDGSVVYGCECWWGTEERIKVVLNQAKKIVNVDINEIRKEWIKKEKEDYCHDE